MKNREHTLADIGGDQLLGILPRPGRVAVRRLKPHQPDFAGGAQRRKTALVRQIDESNGAART